MSQIKFFPRTPCLPSNYYETLWSRLTMPIMCQAQFYPTTSRLRGAKKSNRNLLGLNLVRLLTREQARYHATRVAVTLY